MTTITESRVCQSVLIQYQEGLLLAKRDGLSLVIFVKNVNQAVNILSVSYLHTEHEQLSLMKMRFWNHLIFYRYRVYHLADLNTGRQQHLASMQT